MSESAQPQKRTPDVEVFSPVPSVRVSPHAYLTALFFATFFAGFLLYLEIDSFGVVLLAIAWLVLPFLALNDRIRFDGKRLTRIGVVPKLWSWFNR